MSVSGGKAAAFGQAQLGLQIAINGRRDEVQNPEIPEQRKVGMRAIIEGLKNSIRQTFQNVSQGNNSENIENSIKIIYSTSLIF